MDDMGIRMKLGHFWRNLTYITVCRLLVFFYIFVPIVLKLFPSIFLHTVFSYKYKGPAVYTRLTNPERDWNFHGASNHCLLSQSGNRIGLWHIPPSFAVKESLSKADKVIIYCHGKAGNRASGHRTLLYEVLSDLGFHVVAFDYSGFGDSAGVPNGNTVKLDVISVYRWTAEQLQKTDPVIIVWGHSLGSGIATYALAEFSDITDYKPPLGVILEAPFTNLYDASRTNSVFKIFNTLYPVLWTKMFLSSAAKYKMEFATEKNILRLKTNILLLHSEDDPKVKVQMSEQLFNNVIANRDARAKRIYFYKFESRHGLGHNLIYSYSNLQGILGSFTNETRDSVIPNKLFFQERTV